jgi:CheY-like chemotaxis protein
MEPAARSILVVEDDPIFREITVDALADAGYRASEAPDGGPAIEILRASPPDLVLLDVGLPSVSGWSVLEHVRTMTSPPQVVLMSTGDEIVPPEGFTAHAHASLVKPFSARQLFQTLDLVIAGSSVASGQRAEARRPYVVEALVGGRGYPPTLGRLIQISAHGFRAESRHAFRLGDVVSVSFHVPGRRTALVLEGRVRWRGESTFGAAIEGTSATGAAFLKGLTP